MSRCSELSRALTYLFFLRVKFVRRNLMLAMLDALRLLVVLVRLLRAEGDFGALECRLTLNSKTFLVRCLLILEFLRLLSTTFSLLERQT